MKTLERPQEQLRTTTETTAHRTSRTGIVAAVVAVLALAVGGIAGWMLRGDDTGDIVLAGEGDLTARQEQIVDFMDDYEQAWIDGDTEALEAMYAAGGRFISFGTVYRADDGTLADFVGDGWAIDVQRPVLVRGNHATSFHNWGGDLFVNTMSFTASGDLLLIVHQVTD